MTMQVKHWDPFSHIDRLDERSPYTFLMLNQPVLSEPTLVKLWNGAVYRILVDGATNHFLKLTQNSKHNFKTDTPDLITGDFDSADQANLQHFKEKGVKVICTPDQDRTDFTKSLIELGKYLQSEDCKNPVESVLVFAENSGRFDHIMANLQTLFLAKDEASLDIPVYLVSSHSLTWLLEAGHHSIKLPKSPGHCGLVPLSGPATVTTSGLKWNLSNDVLAFGGLVSTSNGFVEGCEEASVVTDKPILWTMDL